MNGTIHLNFSDLTMHHTKLLFKIGSAILRFTATIQLLNQEFYFLEQATSTSIYQELLRKVDTVLRILRDYTSTSQDILAVLQVLSSHLN